MNAAQMEINRGQVAESETHRLYAELRIEMAKANAALADRQQRDTLLERLVTLETTIDRSVLASSTAMVQALKQFLAEDGTLLAAAIKESVIRAAVNRATQLA